MLFFSSLDASSWVETGVLREVRILWMGERKWYEAMVVAYSTIRPERRYLVRYDDDGEFEWVALAGCGMQEIVQFHNGRANIAAVQKLEDEHHYLQAVALLARTLAGRTPRLWCARIITVHDRRGKRSARRRTSACAEYCTQRCGGAGVPPSRILGARGF